MNALNFDILDETVALHSYMHDIGDKVIHYFVKKKKNLRHSFSKPLSFI